jgi:hypothetical protein
MQFPHVFHQVGLQLRMNLTVSNAQMSLNEFNKFKDMLVRNLFGNGKRINKCREKRKGLMENEEIEYLKKNLKKIY